MEKNDQVEARLVKLDKLRELGVNPYPYKYEVSHNSDQLKEAQE